MNGYLLTGHHGNDMSVECETIEELAEALYDWDDDWWPTGEFKSFASKEAKDKFFKNELKTYDDVSKFVEWNDHAIDTYACRG